MKKISKIIVVGFIVLTILISLSFKFFDIRNNIDKILQSENYSYLPIEAKNYLKAVYEETGEILLTEKNKEENKPYLNPSFVEYLSMNTTKQENIDLIPSETIIDYVNYDSSNEDIELESYYNLSKLDTNNDGIADKNYTSPMKDQGSLGICWAYATIEAAETHLMNINKETYTEGTTQTFSVRQLDYAFSYEGIKNYNNKYGNHQLGTGGSFREASKLLADGLSLFDTTWKYNNLKTTEQLELSDVLNDYYSLYELNSSIEMPMFNAKQFDLSKNENLERYNNYIKTIKQFIKIYGGPYVSTYAPGCSCSAINYNDPKNYIIDVDSNCTKDMGHAMQIIGWDDNYEYKYCSGTKHTKYSSSCPTENVVEGKGAWILRNSWGNYHQHKYTYLTYDSAASEYNFITELSSMENKNWDYIYNIQNENLQVEKITNENSNKNYILHFYNDFNTNATLTKIKFRNSNQNAKYEIYYSGTGLEKDYILLDGITVDYPGYYTYDLPNDSFILNNKTKIKIITTGDIQNNHFSVFTQENTNNQYIITKDKIYNQSNDILENGLYKVYLYSDTYNIDSNSEVSYKLYDSKNNDITSQMNFKNNIVASNRINSILYLPELAQDNYYMIETIYNNDVKSISKITSEVPKPALGTGTKEDPYIIMTTEELYLINYNMDSHYVLGNDIDLTYDTQNENGKYYNFGNGWTAIGYENAEEFTGSIDGYYNNKYHKIIGLNLTDNGLFYKIKSNNQNVNIKNLIFEKAIIKNGNLLANTIEGTSKNKVNIENIAALDCQFYEISNILSSNIKSNSSESVTINNIFSNSTLNEAAKGEVISNLALNVNATTTTSSIKISNIQLLGKLNNRNSIYTSAIFRFGSGTINLSNVILNNYSTYEPYLFGRLSKLSIYHPSINNIYYLNTIKKTAFSDSIYQENNITSKKITELKDTNNYQEWENFDKNWTMETIDGITRIPVLKFVPFEYTSIKDINLKMGDTVNLYDYITPNIEAARNISFEISDKDIASIDEAGNITAINNGKTNIHIISYYDGYEKDIPINITDDTKLTVNFNSNEGIGTMNEVTYSIDEEFSLPSNTFTKEGYTFKEWNTKADGTGISYQDEETIKINSDLTLYAIWEINKYNVTFNSNSGTGTMNNQVFTYNEEKELLKNNFTKEGYTFKEWNTKADGAGTSYQDEETIKVNSDLTLYAIWEKQFYSVTFDANNGLFTENKTIITVTKWEDSKLDSLEKPKREGYTFKGYFTEKIGGTSLENYIAEAGIDKDGLIFYAQWEETYSYIINKYKHDEINKYIDLIDINTSIEDYKKNIQLNVGYSINVDYKTIDNKNILYTGSKTQIYKNQNLYTEYINIIRGETNGDGKINYLDYVNVYNHIYKTKHPESTKKQLTNEYLLAADISNDGKVNYLDYVKIYNKIKEMKGEIN